MEGVGWEALGHGGVFPAALACQQEGVGEKFSDIGVNSSSAALIRIGTQFADEPYTDALMCICENVGSCLL